MVDKYDYAHDGVKILRRPVKEQSVRAEWTECAEVSEEAAITAVESDLVWQPLEAQPGGGIVAFRSLEDLQKTLSFHRR